MVKKGVAYAMHVPVKTAGAYQMRVVLPRSLLQTPPGDYMLQVIVTDKLTEEKYRIAAQSMDFEIRQ